MRNRPRKQSQKQRSQNYFLFRSVQKLWVKYQPKIAAAYPILQFKN